MDININLNFNNNSKKLKLNFILIGILILAAVLRFYNIGFQSPWLDELSTMQVSDPDLNFDNTHLLIMTREGFPHLYFLTLKFLTSIFGHTIVTLRVFSVIFGIISVFIMYLFGKELINKKAGYIAAALIAVNNFHIYHSQEARAYALLFFFVVFASYRMVKYIKTQNWKNAIILGIACGLIPNAHPIGVLNIAVIYLTLLIFFIITKEKIIIFKHLLVSLILTLLVFSPVYQIISKVSDITSFWIPAASIENIKQAFIELLGSNIYVFYIYLISILVFLITILVRIVYQKNIEENKLNYVFLCLILFWIIVNIGVIIVKSYTGISIILNRYFIGSLPLFIITLTYCLSIIKNKYISSFLLVLFMGYSLYNLIYQKTYYSNISKSEWNKVSSEIIINNKNNHKIYSAYGFVSKTLFKNTNCQNLLTETNFESYINSLKTNSIQKESFWYFDGNFRPFSLSQEDQQFLIKNYDLVQQIEKYDCWAKHYVLKGEKQQQSLQPNQLFLKDFNPSNVDNKGNILLFENGKILSKRLKLEKGKYELTLNANSLPNKPIDNINAHIKIFISNKKIGEVFLSEKTYESKKTFTFYNDNVGLNNVIIVFDNDLSKNNLDRNVIIYKIELKKLGIKN